MSKKQENQLTTISGVKFTVNKARGRNAHLPLSLLAFLGIKEFDEKTLISQIMTGVQKLDDQQTDKFYNQFEQLFRVVVPNSTECFVAGEIDLNMMNIIEVIIASLS